MSLENKTLAELYKLARQNNVFNYTLLSKEEIISTLKNILNDKLPEIEVPLEETENSQEKLENLVVEFEMRKNNKRQPRNKKVNDEIDPEDDYEDEDIPVKESRKKPVKKGVARKVAARPSVSNSRQNPVVDISSRVVDFFDIGRKAALEALRKKGLTIAEAFKIRKGIATNLDLTGRHLASFNDGWLDAFQKHIVPLNLLPDISERKSVRRKPIKKKANPKVTKKPAAKKPAAKKPAKRRVVRRKK